MLGHPSQLRLKYQQNAGFRKQMDESAKRYQVLVDAAEKSDLQSIDSNILEKYRETDTHEIYLYYGYLQPLHPIELGKLAMFLMKHFHPNPQKNFSFVFVNSCTKQNQVYDNFKSIFLMLPLQILEHLTAFYMLKPYFYHRAKDWWFKMGILNKHFQSLYHPMNSFKDLCLQLQIPPQNLISILPQQICKVQFPQRSSKKLSASEHRYNLQGQNLSLEQYEEQRLFEDTVKSLVMKPGKEIMLIENYELTELGIPLILEMLIAYFKNNPQGLKEEGIFRKSVSIDEENETLDQIGKHNYDYLLEVKNPHIIANLIKRFFCNLKVPVIPFDLFHELMHDQAVKDKTQHVKQVVAKLPQLNLLSLMTLLLFLKKEVVSVQSQSKMSEQNIAICFSPCLMRSEVASAADLIYASKGVNVVLIMLKEMDRVFGEEKQRKEILRQSYMQQKSSFENSLEISYQCHEAIVSEHTLVSLKEPVQETEEPEETKEEVKQSTKIESKVETKEEFEQSKIEGKVETTEEDEVVESKEESKMETKVQGSNNIEDEYSQLLQEIESSQSVNIRGSTNEVNDMYETAELMQSRQSRQSIQLDKSGSERDRKYSAKSAGQQGQVGFELEGQPDRQSGEFNTDRQSGEFNPDMLKAKIFLPDA